ncbi:YdiU family protein [uncultured Clostridium sp.]|uniref:protein adenylyltransferase SelO n=1 Tax=uncultured Clostridium sp. TaxID=59620 RepID=UPI0025F463D2|nr:YdiU family protein [uncultured Clostridium sp.]
MSSERIISNKYLKLENTYINLPEIFYSKQYPDEVPSPDIVMFNDSLAEELGLDVEFLKSSSGTGVLSGNKILEDSTPIAQAYAGHQFGYFTMLGDGRAVLLGEFLSKSGERFDLQLKGSGVTPYSRGGDGKASLGPMLREYIISEAMNALGIKTTRSLAVTKTGESVIREEILKGAVLSRISSSHIRVGTFQYAANFGSTDDVKALADYTLERHFKKDGYGDNPYLYLLKEVIKRQAELIAQWQLVGFIHGVMNTDNMSICGETIDYGPCAFMDTYNPNTVFSSIDRNGRYAYGNQPKIGVWNLARFAETLLPLLNEDSDECVKIAESILGEFNKLYFSNWYSGMRKKLGLFNEEENDKNLINDLLNIMKNEHEDYTNTFYYLTTGHVEKLKMFKSEKFKSWHKSWKDRLEKQDNSKEDVRNLMEKSNPALIPRNHRVEEALESAVNGDYSVFNSLLDALKKPYDYSNVDEYYVKLPEGGNCQYKTYCGT